MVLTSSAAVLSPQTFPVCSQLLLLVIFLASSNRQKIPGPLAPQCANGTWRTNSEKMNIFIFTLFDIFFSFSNFKDKLFIKKSTEFFFVYLNIVLIIFFTKFNIADLINKQNIAQTQENLIQTIKIRGNMK